MSGSAPTWLAKWFGASAPSAGEGIVWRVSVDWGLAPWVTLLFVAALLCWVAYCYANEAASATKRIRVVLGVLRIVAISVLLLMIAQITVRLERTGLPKLAVLVDHSSSMGVSDTPKSASAAPDANDSQTRIELVKQRLLDHDARWFNVLAREHDVEVFAIATNAKSLGSDQVDIVARLTELSTDAPGCDATRLGASVRQVLADLQGGAVSAMVLFSDGNSTEGESLSEAAEIVAREGVPLFTVGVGAEQRIRDIELADLMVDETVFVGDVVSFEATISAHGMEGESATVELLRNGDDSVLVETMITLGANQAPVKARVPFRTTETGEFEFTVRVRSKEGELQTANNAQTRVVNVREEKVRVLLAASVPSYEFRFLKNMLERDDTIDVSVFLQNADAGFATVDETAISVFPIRADDLYQYDVLILDDIDLTRLTRQSVAHIITFVMEKGGGLVWIAGNRFSERQFRETRELAALLPFANADTTGIQNVATTGFQLRLTEFGETSPSTQIGERPEQTPIVWRTLPSVYWMLEIFAPKPTARVLAEHPTRQGPSGRPLPIILTQYIGAGRVLFHATDETWRWRFRVGDAYFARYWVQTIRQLARSKLLDGSRDVELSSDRTTYQPGEQVRLRARLFDEKLLPADDSAYVVLNRPGGRQRRIELRRSNSRGDLFEAAITGVAPGRYHAVLARPLVKGRAPSTDFRVVGPPAELERLELDTKSLSAAADISQGKYYALDQVDSLIDALPRGRHVPIEQLPPIDLWNRWWTMAIFVCALISEWVIRKRMGMM